MKRPIVALLGAALLISAGVAPASATPLPFTVVASGFHNPRGLAFGPQGRLYVAEAGLGAGNRAAGVVEGFGLTGQISQITGLRSSSPRVRVIATKLPSAANSDGVIGPSGIATQGEGNIFVQIGLSQQQTGIPNNEIGRLLRVARNGKVRTVANIGDFDYAWSMQHQNLAPHDFNPGDSNPYGVLATARGEYVVDAGTNTLDWVSRSGQRKILAYFPNNTMADATPTCVTRGPDGALYIGTLAFVDSLGSILDPHLPPPNPSAVVYRVDPGAADPDSLPTVLSLATPWATSLWPITGCAASRTTFYASQFISGVGQTGPFGDVVAIPFANPSQHTSLTNGMLAFPGGVAIGPDHHVYVANMSTSANGEVVRLP